MKTVFLLCSVTLSQRTTMSPGFVMRHLKIQRLRTNRNLKQTWWLVARLTVLQVRRRRGRGGKRRRIRLKQKLSDEEKCQVKLSVICMFILSGIYFIAATQNPKMHFY